MGKREEFWRDRDPVLEEMWLAGERTVDIARAVGVHVSALEKRRRAIGLDPRVPGNRFGRLAGFGPCRQPVGDDDDGPDLAVQVARADEMLRRRMAGRAFADANVPDEPRLRLSRVVPEADWRYGSSLELPA